MKMHFLSKRLIPDRAPCSRTIRPRSGVLGCELSCFPQYPDAAEWYHPLHSLRRPGSSSDIAANAMLPVTLLICADEFCVSQHMALHSSLDLRFRRTSRAVSASWGEGDPTKACTALTIEVRDSHSHRNRVRWGLAAIGANKYRVLKDHSAALIIGAAPIPCAGRALCDITWARVHRGHAGE